MSFHCWVLFHCKDVLYFVYPLICWWTFEFVSSVQMLWVTLLCVLVFGSQEGAVDLMATLGWPFKKYFGHVLPTCESHRHSKLSLMSYNSCSLSINQTSAGKTSELTASCQIEWPSMAGSNAAISFKSVVETNTYVLEMIPAHPHFSQLASEYPLLTPWSQTF